MEEWQHLLELAFKKWEAEAQAQSTRQYGLLIEVDRDEILEHLEERARHYRTESSLLAEVDPIESVPSELRGTMHEAAIRREHQARIAQMRGKARTLQFVAKHLPQGKKTFLFGYSECQVLDLIIEEVSYGRLG